MELQDWLKQQQQYYAALPPDQPTLATHPSCGTWQTSEYLKNQFWWGGGASVEACEQIQQHRDLTLSHIGVLTFGPVQSFLAGGQRLRDWAVASWLCHYLCGVVIYHWEKQGGKVLVPLHQSSPLLQWLNGETITDESFWQAELPNIITGLFPDEPQWWENCQDILKQEWQRFLTALETASIRHNPRLNGLGWQVIQGDNLSFWSVYGESNPLRSDHIVEDIEQLHHIVEAQKLGRQWQGNWWGGRTSPSSGSLSIWHPGLQPVEAGGTWGLPDQVLTQWWEGIAEKSSLAGLFSESDRLNSLEMVKRLASVPEIIVPTLTTLWGQEPPRCPWDQFPDRTAAAAAWVADVVDAEQWNTEVEALSEYYQSGSPFKPWGIPQMDRQSPPYAHPRVLERRNIDAEEVEGWENDLPNGWESPVEWTVGWRGDGDNMGKWLSGEQYQKLKLPWSNWHPNASTIEQYQLGFSPPNLPDVTRQMELPHTLDLSVLFGYWNRVLYNLTENYHNGRVIFAGGDDFLLLGPITDAIALTSQLHQLWTGQPTPLTQPLDPPVAGWVSYQNQIYPIPGPNMTFSLGVVIAQRRIPQSLWHRGLNEAYKQAKHLGKDRVCVRVLFNSGQSLDWVCPWVLWHLLMAVEPVKEDKTDLNCWEKLLFYLESTRLEEYSPSTVRSLMDTLWASVHLPLSWQQIDLLTIGNTKSLKTELGRWQWWKDWIALRGFLARQQRERNNWLSRVLT